METGGRMGEDDRRLDKMGWGDEVIKTDGTK